jgi:hypothetical protein
VSNYRLTGAPICRSIHSLDLTMSIRPAVTCLLCGVFSASTEQAASGEQPHAPPDRDKGETAYKPTITVLFVSEETAQVHLLAGRSHEGPRISVQAGELRLHIQSILNQRNQHTSVVQWAAHIDGYYVASAAGP